ncbi:YxeA family protein [Listeria sp. PSOL-1]|uniref:YxeA family protein n=1 Tax=Listeria sp. PSOL-1 TaxID=1844999 RepID=UPI0013D68E56|nr:YxeA family protein [Listeria sp. PSOL-1]
MKLLISILVVVVAVFIAGWFFLSTYYGSKDYYVKITMDPIVKKDKAPDGIVDTFYNYKVTGFGKDGQERKLNLESQDKMEKNQYYIIHWEDRRNIISSKEKVKQKDIPSNILKKLE